MNRTRTGTVLSRLITLMSLLPRDGYVHLSTLYHLIPDALHEHIRGELNKNTLKGKRYFKRFGMRSGMYRLSQEDIIR